ncbi:MAG: CBS domain-containing protein [Candidatus Diapherotrites archaeon]
MRSLVLGRPFGISIELHWSFILLVFFVLISALAEGIESMLSTATLFFFLFMSVAFHELVHSIVSINRGIPVHRIVLLPIGGVAVAEELPEKPTDEFLISISGPLFNFSVVVAVIFLIAFFSIPFPWHILFQDTVESEIDNIFFQYPFFTLLYVNLLLGSFNLFLPALPLDGGRVLRSLLGMKLGMIKATRVVTTISAITALFLFIVSFAIQNLFLTIISVFIFLGSKEEARIIETKHALENIKIDELLDTDPIIVEPTIPIYIVLEELFYRKKFSCLVDYGSKRYGLLDIDLLPEKINPQEPVGKYAIPVESVDAKASTNKILEKFLAKGYSMVPVMESGQLIGTISHSSIEKAYKEAKIREKLFGAK